MKELAKPSMWRTIIAMVVTDIALIISLYVCAGKGDLAEKLLATTSWSLVLSLAAVAGHNSIQHLASTGGGGFKGAINALVEKSSIIEEEEKKEDRG